MFCAWRYGGEDPWRLYNRLGSDYRPVWDPSLPEVRPAFPDRLQRFMYAMGKAAAIVDGKMKDERPSRAPVRPRAPGVVLPPGIVDTRDRPDVI